MNINEHPDFRSAIKDNCSTTKDIPLILHKSQKKADPIGQNIAWPTCALTYYLLYTYLWLLKLNCEPSRGHQSSPVAIYEDIPSVV